MEALRLLVVDDEATLTDLLAKYLERIGYEVDSFTSADAAIARFAEDPTHYSLVLTDLTLTDVNGEEMIQRMRVLNPALRAIISSGYPYQPRSPLTGFLQKPFVPKMLAEMIEQMLKGKETAQSG